MFVSIIHCVNHNALIFKLLIMMHTESLMQEKKLTFIDMCQN